MKLRLCLGQLTWVEYAIQSKTSTWVSGHLKKKKTGDLGEHLSLSPRYGHAILVSGISLVSDRCQLTKTWMSNIKDVSCKLAWYWSHWHTWRGGRTDVRTYGRSWRHGYKTKFSHIDGLPYFLNYGAPSAGAFRRARSFAIIAAKLMLDLLLDFDVGFWCWILMLDINRSFSYSILHAKIKY